MTLTGGPLIGIGVFSVALLGILSATESALNQVGIHRVRRTLEAQQKPSNGSERSEEPPVMQLQSNVLQTLLICRLLIILLVGGLICLLALQNEETLQRGLVVAGGVFALLFVEIAARQIAVNHPHYVAHKTYPLGLFLSRIFYPGVLVLRACTRPLVPKANPKLNPLGTSLEEIHEDLLQLQMQGVLEQDETQIIQSVFEFGETIAKEVMVPRVDMVCVELGSPLRKVLDLMIASGFTRLPVFEEDVDTILGLVHAKDLLRKLESKDVVSFHVTPISKDDLREIMVVPGTKKISKTLRDLQRGKMTMAIVVDEYGGTDGLLTLEDIVEEIVGEITDEYDQASEGVQLQRDGSSVVDAKMVLEDVNEFLKLDLPVDEHETLGGYVYGLFGRVPKAGESVEMDGLRITVESTHRQRITRVRIRPVEEGVPSHEVLPVASGV